MILFDTNMVGGGVGIEGAFDANSVKAGAGFFGQQIYLLAVNAASPAGANQVGVFTNPAWIFPASDAGVGGLDLSDPGTTSLIGSLADGTVSDPNLGAPPNVDAAALLGPTNSWAAASGKWETTTNWSTGSAPSLNDASDLITSAGNKTVTIDATTSGSFPGTMTIADLLVSAPLTSTNTLSLAGAGTNTPLLVLNRVRINNRGALFITNSVLQVDGPTGGALTVDGELTMDSGTILVSSNLLVGPLNSLSTFTIAGGALFVTNVAHSAVTEVRFGTLVLTGGVFFTDTLLSTNPSGKFINNGGTFTITGLDQVSQGTQTIASGVTQLSSNLLIGTSANSTGTVSITGGSLVVTNGTTAIGNLGVGNMIISNGTVTTSETDVAAGTNSQGTLTLQSGSAMTVFSNLTVGSALGASGIVNVAGGQLVVTNGVIGVGNDGTSTNGVGTGLMIVSNGTVFASQILLGSGNGGHGDLTIQTNGIVSFESSGAGTNTRLIANDLILNGGLLSITNGTLYCGRDHPGAMTMSNGIASCQAVYIGYDYFGSMAMLGGTMTMSSGLTLGYVAGSTGQVWLAGGQMVMTNLPTLVGNSGVGQMVLSNGNIQVSTIFVGNTSGPGGTLSVSGGTLTLSGDLKIGTSIQSTGTVWVTGGQLLVASSTITVGNNSGKGQFTISNGVVQANSLILTNGIRSVFRLSGGNLISSGTSVTNGQNFLVGNGSSAAVFNLLGGVHSFANNLEIANNATLSGCGTINGSSLVDAGGTVVATCGALTFTGILTNNGTMRAINGGVIESYGTIVNNGFIDVFHGNTNFHGAFINHGTVTGPNTVLDSSKVQISDISCSGADVTIEIESSVVTHTYQLQVSPSLTPTNWTNTAAPQGGTGGNLTFIDLGGATNRPLQIYRIRVSDP